MASQAQVRGGSCLCHRYFVLYQITLHIIIEVQWSVTFRLKSQKGQD